MMTSSQNGPFLMKCENCGMKINTLAQQIGGDTLCQHKMVPIITPQAPQAKQRIVYPTDPERKWLGIMDQNKSENEVHSAKFKKDINILNQLKNKGLQDIKDNIASLQEKLVSRSKILQKNLTDSFNERQKAMYSSLQKLSDHKKNNEETKQQSEDLLLSSTPVQQREKT
eukprot:220249_1